MRVLQFAKRPVLTLAAITVALFGCGGNTEPVVPFNPAGASDDMAAVGATFGSQVYASFSQLGLLFDAALGTAPLVSGSTAMLNGRGGAPTIQGSAARAQELLRQVMRPQPAGNVSASVATIPPQYVGKTFVYSAGAYVVSTRTGAPANGVRFILYALDPVTLLPVEPVANNEIGYVDLIDMSAGTTSAARVIVVSQNVTYLDYRVSVTATSTTGRVTVLGFLTDGTTEATFNLRATLNSLGGLTLVESIDVPMRDLSVDLTLNTTGTTPETATIGITLDMRGQNGWVRLTGQSTATSTTLNVLINGNQFATINQPAGGAAVITGANGAPLSTDEQAALEAVFNFSAGAFLAFDQLAAPVGAFIS
jgi:hypothetical protein